VQKSFLFSHGIPKLYPSINVFTPEGSLLVAQKVVTPELHFWPTPFHAFALVTNPRLRSWHYMWCCRQCSLHHICASRVNNDSVHQSMEVISNNKNIHSSTSVVREKVGDLPLNMCSTLQSNSSNNIPKCIMGYYTFIPTGALKQMGT
jgi:hypothetical protein